MEFTPWNKSLALEISSGNIWTNHLVVSGRLIDQEGVPKSNCLMDFFHKWRHLLAFFSFVSESNTQQKYWNVLLSINKLKTIKGNSLRIILSKQNRKGSVNYKIKSSFFRKKGATFTEIVMKWDRILSIFFMKMKNTRVFDTKI